MSDNVLCYFKLYFVTFHHRLFLSHLKIVVVWGQLEGGIAFAPPW